MSSELMERILARKENDSRAPADLPCCSALSTGERHRRARASQLSWAAPASTEDDDRSP